MKRAKHEIVRVGGVTRDPETILIPGSDGSNGYECNAEPEKWTCAD